MWIRCRVLAVSAEVQAYLDESLSLEEAFDEAVAKDPESADLTLLESALGAMESYVAGCLSLSERGKTPDGAAQVSRSRFARCWRRVSTMRKRRRWLSDNENDSAGQACPCFGDTGPD